MPHSLDLATLPPRRPPSSYHRLTERLLVVFFLVLLGLSYGAFAVLALHGARSEAGAWHVSDFATTGANPWEPALGIEPPPGESLAHIGSRSVATP